MALEFKKVRLIGCAVCNNTFGGPTGGVCGEESDLQVWDYLHAAAENDAQWFTVSHGDGSALVCSLECAGRWLRGETKPDPFGEWEGYTGPPRSPIIKEIVAELPEPFRARDIVARAQETHPEACIDHSNVQPVLKSLIKKGLIRKEGERNNSQHFRVPPEERDDTAAR